MFETPFLTGCHPNFLALGVDARIIFEKTSEGAILFICPYHAPFWPFKGFAAFWVDRWGGAIIKTCEERIEYEAENILDFKRVNGKNHTTW